MKLSTFDHVDIVKCLMLIKTLLIIFLLLTFHGWYYPSNKHNKWPSYKTFLTKMLLKHQLGTFYPMNWSVFNINATIQAYQTGKNEQSTKNWFLSQWYFCNVELCRDVMCIFYWFTRFNSNEEYFKPTLLWYIKLYSFVV